VTTEPLPFFSIERAAKCPFDPPFALYRRIPPLGLAILYGVHSLLVTW
jgi:hypothetical protein